MIGATTSGAAKNKAMLDAAEVTVVLVEEAGEILESHVITSLSSATKHLILIGTLTICAITPRYDDPLVYNRNHRRRP